MSHPPHPTDPAAMLQQYNAWLYQQAYAVIARAPWADIEDLVQEGRIAMLHCHARYDPARGACFMTFARRYVRAAMRDCSLAARSVIRCPRDWHSAGRHVQSCSIDAPLEAGSEATFADILPAPEPEPPLYEDEDRARLQAALGALPARLRRVLRHYYLRGRTDRYIAAKLRITNSRTQQLRMHALQLLRQSPHLQRAA